MVSISPSGLFDRYSDTDVAQAATDGLVRDVIVAGTVEKDPHYFVGTRTHALHETFPIVTEHGLRIDVIDNVDLAPRVPLHAGDIIAVAGQFIPDGKGSGIIHDTHHSPGPGWHRGGWIEWHGHRFEALTPHWYDRGGRP